MKDNFNSSINENLKPYALPENWMWFFWEDIMQSYQQGMIRSNLQLGDGNVKYLKMGDLDSSGTANLSKLKKTEASEKEIVEYALNEGDFLINVRNSLSLVGKTCVIDEIKQDKILFNHMLVRIDNGSVDMNYFINAFLNTPTSKKMLNRLKEGTTTVIALYQRELNKLPIALPDSITFEAIVQFYKSLRLKIEINNKINAELEAMTKLIYDYWFVQFDFPDENGKPYKSSGGKMVYNEELKREIPEGWEVGVLKNWIDKDKSGDWGKESDQGNYVQKVSCIRGADINGLSGKGEVKSPTRYILEKNSHKILERGDLIVEISGGSPSQSTGRLAFIIDKTLERFEDPLICSNFCKAVTLKEEKALYNFVYVWNRLYDAGVLFGWEGKTSGIKNLLFDSFVSNYLLTLPPKNLMEQFYEKVDPIHGKIQKNLEENNKLAELRDWLLPMLMNGQVTVN
jgi:type I restriction enzyme S subunit